MERWVEAETWSGGWRQRHGAVGGSRDMEVPETCTVTTIRCSVLQCVAVCCSVFQCVAVRCSK